MQDKKGNSMENHIEEFCKKLRAVLKRERKAVNETGRELWTHGNFNDLYDYITDEKIQIKGTNLSFNQKLIKQIEGLGEKKGNAGDYLALMIEVLTIYYAYPTSISKKTKQENLKELYSSQLAIDHDLSESYFQFSLAAIQSEGIGSGGMGYNTNRYSEIMYLLKVFTEWFKQLEAGEVNIDYIEDVNGFQFQQFLDNEKVSDGKMPQCRHLLLYFLFPDYYQRIISSGHKKRIIRVFKDFCSDEKLKEEIGNQIDELEVTMDQSLSVIAKALEGLTGKKTDFYESDLEPFWNFRGTDAIKSLDIEALEYKKQIVLYGPPGTGKTHTAKALAGEIITYTLAQSLGTDLLKKEGREKKERAIKNNIHRLQLHPAYTYEDFIGGLQFINGDTKFQKGFLLNLLDQMQGHPDMPHALILDEINRVDLSRLFGECFSALENRGEPIDLLAKIEGKHIQLTIPNNLYIIGTMNLIDHSVEQLDFALRRRFLWVEANYNPDALLEICAQNWQKLTWGRKAYAWEKVENDFNRLIEAADALNDAIEKHEELGPDFKLGHVFFIDAVKFLHQELDDYVSKSTFLFTPKGGWRSPIEKLWNLSLSPLLSEYLSGLDHKAKQDIMKKLKTAFSPKPIQ